MPEADNWEVHIEDGYDAVAAFERRRAIFLSVQETQRLEHEAIQRIAGLTRNGKQELLSILCDWLLKQNRISEAHARVEVLSGCNMREWITLQAAVPAREFDVNTAMTHADEASAQYKAVAPLGGLTKLMADSEKKAKIEELAAVSQQNTAALRAAETRLNENIRQRRTFAKRFLRGCLVNIEELEHAPMFDSRAQAIISEMTRSITAEWDAHTKAVRGASATILGNVNDINHIYRTMEG